MPHQVNLAWFGLVMVVIVAVVVRRMIAAPSPRWIKALSALPFAMMMALFVSTYIGQWVGREAPSPETGQTAAWLYQGHTYYISETLLHVIKSTEQLGITAVLIAIPVFAIYHFVIKRPDEPPK